MSCSLSFSISSEVGKLENLVTTEKLEGGEEENGKAKIKVTGQLA